MLVSFFCFTFLFQSVTSVPSISDNNYLTRHFTVEDGLPVNAVSDIAQDEDGYLWFATLNGLARYDGYKFETFNSSTSEGIISERFTGMLMTSSGDIWLPVESGYLTLYHNKTFKTYTEKEGIVGQIFSLKETSDGTLWVATSNGLRMFDPTTDQFHVPDDMLLSNTRAIEPMENGDLLVVNDHGLLQFADGNVQTLLQKDNFPFALEGIMTLKQLSDGAIWVLTKDNFFVFKKEFGIIYSSENTDSRNFIAWNVFENNSEIFLSTSNGFFRVDSEDYRLERLPIETDPFINRPNTILIRNNETIFFGNQVVIDGHIIFETEAVKTGFIDREGSIWVTSERNGLYQLRKSIITNLFLYNGLPIENIYPIIQDSRGDVWAGSLLTGVYRFREEGTDFWDNGNSSLNTTQTRFLYQDGDSTIYMGSWRDGLWKFIDNDWVHVSELEQFFEESSATVEGMLRADDGTLFIGTRSRTILERDGKYQTMEDSLGSGFEGVRVIRQSSDNTLFFGTNGEGIGILKPSRKRTTITIENGLLSNFIRDIFIESQDTLWVATENRGLARVLLNPNKTVESIQTIHSEDGLIDNSLHRIIADAQNNFWVSSNSGIMKISRRDLNAYADEDLDNLSVTSYNQQDGMINSEANGGVQTAGVLTDDNEIWFPNQKGITILNLSEPDLVEKTRMIKPQIEDVILPDTTLFVSNDTTVSIPRGQRNFNIRFTAPNFAYPERVSFKYRLSGVSDDWIAANKSREAVFTNLNPGTHQFDVQTDPGNGNLSNASINLIVPPYFYETTVFYIIMTFIGGLFLYGGVKYRTHALVMREQKLQKRVDQQTVELQEAADHKSRFFTGITHELKTPLSLILGPLDDLAESQKPDNWKKTQSQLQMMKRNGYRLQNLVDQILDVTKLNAEAIKLILQPVHFEQLTRQIVGQFQSRLVQKKINIVIEADEIYSEIYLDREAWERIMINLMSNAIKFSPAEASIQLFIKNYKDEVALHVKDEGRGIKEEDHARVFEYLYQLDGIESAEGTGIGLFLVKGLVEQMGGTIQLISKEGAGAEFIVTLKKGFSHFQKSDIVRHNPPVNNDSELDTSIGRSSISEPVDKPSEEERILLVEDNDDFRSYLQSILSKTYHVLTAAEGKEALEILKSETPNLVISDVMMPGMNGLEFVNSLRKQEQFSHLPVIFLSAKNLETDKETGLSSGADIYLTKPIRSKMLLAQVAAVLRRERVLTIEKKGENRKDEPEIIKQVREIVYRQLANPSLNVNVLADALYMSRTKLYGEWKKVSDISLNDFIKKHRLNEGKFLIEEKGFSVQQASQAVGFSTVSYFSTSFKKEFGKLPSAFKV